MINIFIYLPNYTVINRTKEWIFMYVIFFVVFGIVNQIIFNYYKCDPVEQICNFAELETMYLKVNYLF